MSWKSVMTVCAISLAFALGGPALAQQGEVDQAPTADEAPQPDTATAETAEEGPAELPETASPLPLLALAGGLAISAGAVIRRLRRV